LQASRSRAPGLHLARLRRCPKYRRQTRRRHSLPTLPHIIIDSLVWRSESLREWPQTTASLHWATRRVRQLPRQHHTIWYSIDAISMGIQLETSREESLSTAHRRRSSIRPFQTFTE